MRKSHALDEAAEETRGHGWEEPVQTTAGFGEKRCSRDGKKYRGRAVGGESFDEASGSFLGAVAGSAVEDEHEYGRDHSPAKHLESEGNIGLWSDESNRHHGCGREQNECLRRTETEVGGRG